MTFNPHADQRVKAFPAFVFWPSSMFPQIEAAVSNQMDLDKMTGRKGYQRHGSALFRGPESDMGSSRFRTQILFMIIAPSRQDVPAFG
jgi:hypothetical protein